MAKYTTTLYCVICKKTHTAGHDTRRDQAEFHRRNPGPYYCLDHNPKLLHGQEKVDFAVSLIGKKFFNLKDFMQYAISGPFAVCEVRIDSTTTYTAEGAKENIGWTRVYWLRGIKEPDMVWDSPESFIGARPITEDEVAAAVQKAKDSLNSIPGFNRSYYAPSTERAITAILARDYLVIVNK